MNPIQAEESALRTTLVPSLLRAAQLNLSRQAEGLRLFEIGRAFEARGAGELPRETWQAAALWTDAKGASLWERRDVPLFFRAKGAAEAVLAELGCAATFRAGSREPFLHPGASGELLVGEETVAVLGELHPESAAAFGLEAELALLVLDLDALLRAPRSAGRYRELSRHPKVRPRPRGAARPGRRRRATCSSGSGRRQARASGRCRSSTATKGAACRKGRSAWPSGSSSSAPTGRSRTRRWAAAWSGSCRSYRERFGGELR